MRTPSTPRWAEPLRRSARRAGDHLRVGPGDHDHPGGAGLVYLRDGGSLSVHNVLTGADAIAYESEPTAGSAVPVLVSGSGAAVARTDRYVLLTGPPADG